VKIAMATHSVVAELRTVPNQPLVFHNDGQDRYEDDLLGYSWDRFLKTGDATWPAQLPMAKSVVRAMDTIQAMSADKQRFDRPIKRFVVAGASKRGWTTWLTAAADRRVAAIVPIVIDVLNIDASMRHHYAAYGFWAPAIQDYVHHRIMERLDTPRLHELYGFVDPLSYVRRLTMPKYIVNSSGDQFFLPDSSQFYFDKLLGEKHLRYVPNTDHGLGESDAMQTIVAFYQMVLHGQPRPEISWTCQDDGTIRVKTASKPREVNLWQAANPDARDFRLETIGGAFRSSPLEATPEGEYVARIDPPAKGWTAFFAEFVFDTPGDNPLKLTTPVRVLPETLPFKDQPIRSITEPRR
jgi:PhoPQ-activated pathogenicity-related protein